MSINDNDNILRLVDLKKHFIPHQTLLKSLVGKPKRVIKAVDGLTFNIRRGEIFGLIGESGSGKTTTGKLVMKLLEPTSGQLIFNEEDVTNSTRERTIRYRREVQMIFQDPYASMNPRFKIKDVLREPLQIHKIEGDREKHEAMILKALQEVKLNPPEEFITRYPHMLSGGQRQRVSTARTLILNPMMLVADEPVSMIDLSTRAEILAMMKDVQRHLNLTYLYITHDLSTARYFTDRIAVMYLGRIVEMGPADEVIDNPLHPYTRALISAVPEPECGKVDIIKEVPISGEIPSPANIPCGCRFHTRCPFTKDECINEAEPELMDIGGGHLHACRRWKEI
ncbi:MAG: oligopeptide ABC transporter ATP-binding protein [Spirochaetes bacterium GWD1_61_31]|nr:MAG: oligopeptide ABC transporter ATP-binding protein [Spirochaetes bacterium GWB1_60_80]OHD33058.1 MAG: oligopeptide ABC transporter ATP-binding protein [Spirochaetes bacterium GWC1_61_12]OHD44358.1 MAG: oligopeptide ABC transporter ATP-binding protein [Spirochaetes bacterium GWD1_61_31]OHD46891.1 MAG: oligopeptide ABC transporter ATP-binding protein [Spirochaetes bacterium GWE1_60_18]OHD61132.1 MAG: oligopeptide ABC transporter ATP-binding protein [Spirochaetes bacterium GWF1_60_12]HAX375